MHVLIRRTAALAFLALGAGAPLRAAPVIGAPVVVASTGDVVAIFVGSDAGFESQLGLVGGPAAIFDNKSTPAGTTYDLGTFAAGTVLRFSLYVVPTLNTFYSGPAADNPDGIEHAAVDTSAAGTTVGFEDQFGGGDRDYNDLTFSFTNTTNVPVTAAVPEPATWALMLVGFAASGTALRRSRPARIPVI